MNIYAVILEWHDGSDCSFGSNFWVAKSKEDAERILEEEYEALKKDYTDDFEEKFKEFDDGLVKEIHRYDGECIDRFYIDIKTIKE